MIAKPSKVYTSFILILLLLLVSACGSAAPQSSEAPAAEPVKVKIFLPTSPIAWGFYLAEEKGYFEEEGVDAEITVFNSGREASEAFRALEADILEAGDMPTITFLQGGDAVTVGQVARSEKGIQLIAPTSIQGPEDLKGKTIGTNFGSTTEFYLRTYLQDNGLEDEVEIINLDPPSQVPALLQGDVDATFSFLEIAVRALEDPNIHLVDAWGSSLMMNVSKKFAEEHPDAVVGVLRALTRAAEDVEADPQAAVNAVSGKHGLVDQAYEDYLSYGGIDVQPQYTTVTDSFMREVADFLLELGTIEEPFDFCANFDVSFLKEANPEAITVDVC